MMILEKNRHRSLPFTEAVRDITGGNPKVKKSDYSEFGSVAIIDQGSEFISGYTDDESKICNAKLPAIIFGDHTKIFKFVTVPFALGADGVKVLEPKIPMDKKFLFHFLKQVHLPKDAGYSRHFKFLKESSVLVPPLEEQKRIANILDKADALRRKRAEAIRLTDEFLKSTFLDMFGDPITNPMGWDLGKIGDLLESVNYGTSKKAHLAGGKFPVLRMGNLTYNGGWDFTELKYVDLTEKEEPKHLVYKGQLLFNRTNSKELVGKTAVYRENTPMAFAGYLIRGISKPGADIEYVSAYLNSKHGKSVLIGMCKSIVGMANINAKEMQSIPIHIPPYDLQKQFGDIARSTLLKRVRWADSNAEIESLFSALQQQAFRGEL